MKRSVLWPAFGIAVLGLMIYEFNTYNRDTNPRTISVTGECLTTAPRDRTAVTLRVSTLDKSASVSMKTATALVAEITDYLKTLDVQMQTTEFNSYEKSEWNHELQKSEVLGVETSISVDVSADNMDVIERVLSRFAGVENIYVGNLRMYSSSQVLKPILEQCMGTATQNARERANALVAADGRRAGRMLAVSYGASPSMQPRFSNFLRSAKEVAVADAGFDAVAVTGASLVSKDTEVSVTVNAVFEIK